MSLVPEPLALSQALIRRPSVTPEDAGALDALTAALVPLGFRCRPFRFGVVDNLYARVGVAGRNFCFAGHTDVVPVGDAGAWSVDPFAGVVRDGMLIGRGAADMKTAIACFVAAVGGFLDRHGGVPPGSISLLVTGDEEGPAVDGTIKVLAALAKEGERLDACLVGEPTNPSALGEMVKIGRRGSLNARIVVHGTQGHAAYPERADNPLPRLVALLAALLAEPLDHGTEHFQPSTLTLTSLDVGNPATNVIPAKAEAKLNIRFNDRHAAESLRAWLEGHCARSAGRHELVVECSGEAFLCPSGPLAALVAGAVRRVTGLDPELSTSGGTSDARFIKDFCPVVEFGMVGATAHQVDERVPVADLARLTAIYGAVLDAYFADVA